MIFKINHLYVRGKRLQTQMKIFLNDYTHYKLPEDPNPAGWMKILEKR